LKKTVLNSFYQSYFSNECIYSYDSYDTCYPDGREETLPSNLIELYKKFERNLTLLCDESKKFDVELEKNKEKLCFYLKYWIYDQLISNDVSQDHFSQFFNLWNENKGKKYPGCDCKFEITNLRKVNLLKQAYDYFLFLEAYETTAKIHENVSTMNYCKYIEDAKAAYLSYPYICERSNTENCKEFKKYIAPHMKTDDNSSIICNMVLSSNPGSEEAIQGLKRPDHNLYSGTVEAQGPKVEGEGTTLTTGIERESAGAKLESEPGKEQDIILKSEAEEEISSPGPILHHQKKDDGTDHDLPNELPGVEGDRFSSLLGTSSEGNGSPIKTITSASMVGIPSIIFLLYKFTPIRTWIDPRIRKTKNVLRNGVNESNELQSNDYNFDHADMDINRYNIAYQSR
ncbi:Plasmodium vivax Vir protein, putative, partial [Plasmodium vivax]